MTSEFDRRAVFQATKVKTSLKQDGSWIHRSQVDLDTQLNKQQTHKPPVPVKPLSSAESSPVSMPSAQSPASSSQDSPRTHQRSYVLSALKTFEAIETPADILVEEVVKIPVYTRVQKALKTPAEKTVEIATHVEEASKTLADTPIEEAMETLIVTHVKGAFMTPEDTPKEEAVETLIVTHVEEALKTPIDIPLEEGVETVIVTHVKEALKTSADTPVEKAEETLTITHVEETLKTPIDTPVEETVEIQVYTRVQEALKTQAHTPVVETGIITHVEEAMKTPVNNPVEETVETHIVTNVEDSVEMPVYTRVQDALKTPVDSYEEEALKASADMASTDHGPYSEALLERAVETLVKNPAETSGTYITKNGVDDTVEIVTTAIKHTIEATFESRQSEVQHIEATSYHEELSLESALKASNTKPSETMVLSTELTVGPSVAAPAEHHRLNSQAGDNLNGKTICTFCKLPIDGNVKITANIPAISSHPDCFKCDGCSKFMGNLLSPMFHYAGKILCKRCFDKIFLLE